MSTIGKKLVKQQYVLHISPQYGELRPTSGWDRLTSLGYPSKFQLVSRLSSVTARHLVVGVSQTLRRWTEGATYIRQGDHHVGLCPKFIVLLGCAVSVKFFCRTVVMLHPKHISKSFFLSSSFILAMWSPPVHILDRYWPNCSSECFCDEVLGHSIMKMEMYVPFVILKCRKTDVCIVEQVKSEKIWRLCVQNGCVRAAAARRWLCTTDRDAVTFLHTQRQPLHSGRDNRSTAAQEETPQSYTVHTTILLLSILTAGYCF